MTLHSSVEDVIVNVCGKVVIFHMPLGYSSEHTNDAC